MSMVGDLTLDEAAPAVQKPRRQVTAPSLTVGELIAQLRKADPDAPVVISGAYGGFASVLAVDQRPLSLNVNRLEGFGPHDLPADGEKPDVVALAILTETAALE